MNRPADLLRRLDEIGRSLAQHKTAQALIGLGSVGQETDRLDDYSDLDFFVIVAAGSKPHYLDDLAWLSDVAPIAYRFRNTADGYKLLFTDGIFCEFAIFELAELAGIPFSAGRIVWKVDGVPDSIAVPQRSGEVGVKSADFHLGEALTNLYVGLMRERRGEKMSALRFIQTYAVDHVLRLAELMTEAAPHGDRFDPARRVERRHPQLATLLPSMLQGYQHNRQAAHAILHYLANNFDVNPAMQREILALCDAEGCIMI